MDITEVKHRLTKATWNWHSPSTGYKPVELAAVKLARRASSDIVGGRKQPLLSSRDPDSGTSAASATNIEAWLPVYGTPDISGNGRHWGDVSTSTSSFPDVAALTLPLLHSGRRTAPTAATGRPDPAARPAETHPQERRIYRLSHCPLKLTHSAMIYSEVLHACKCCPVLDWTDSVQFIC